MKKRILLLLSAVCLLLASCSVPAEKAEKADEPTEYPDPVPAVASIDHCVLEPDDRAQLSDDDINAYRSLTEAMLARRESVAPDVKNTSVDHLLELLRQSPYYYFIKTARVDGSDVHFTYAYSAEKQDEMLAFIDSELLRIANNLATDSDNSLDAVLKIYLAITSEFEYDEERTDNKKLGSPLFVEPADEIYKALRDKKCLCYGFAYIMRFALLQRGIDCFCVSGLCTTSGDGHEWIVFNYDDTWFHCDPTWDRKRDRIQKLMHFGKTDKERFSDELESYEMTSCADPAYAEIECTDERFRIFRSNEAFSYEGGHRFRLTDINGDESVFNTETFSFED